MEVSSILVPGVTRPYVDPRACSLWLSAVHHAMRERGGEVVGSVQPPGPGRSYYRVRVLTAAGGHLRLLLNVVALVVAAAQDDDPLALASPFCDVPGEHVFQLFGFRCLAGAQLAQSVADEQLAALGSDERTDIAYHQPGRLGDLLFNWFD